MSMISEFKKVYLSPLCRNVKMYIFVASTGRSATFGLAKVFQGIQGCAAFHEPTPIMHGEAMIKRNAGDESLAKSVYHNKKSLQIRKMAIGAKYYLEANHMFIKTFADYAAHDFKDKLKVIHLFRDPVDVANSIYSLENCPGTPDGNKWWLDYHGKMNEIQIADLLDNDPEFKHDFYKALWYWYEIEARTAAFKKQFPKVPVFEVMTNELNDIEKMKKLVSQLGIDFKEEWLLDGMNKKVNLKHNDKKREPIEKTKAKEMHKQFQDLLKKKYSLPATLEKFSYA